MRQLREYLFVLLVLIGIVAGIFYPVFFQKKILFPSNLLVSTYAPWRYEPVEEFPNGPPNKPVGFDNVRQFFPNRKILGEELRKMSIPLWNPYIYSGVPFMGSFDTAVWYPLSWISAVVSDIDGWNFLVISQPILIFITMYLLLRSLGVRVVSALFGTIAYTLSGWVVVYWQEILVLEHSFLWLPLALYASRRIWTRQYDWIGYIFLIISLVFSIFAGFMQMAIYVYACTAAWNAYQYLLGAYSRQRNQTIIRVIGAFIISLCISSVQLLPSIEAFLMSPRGLDVGHTIISSNLLPISHLITLIAPDYFGNPATYNYFGGNGFYFEKMIYIGIIPLLFALYAAWVAPLSQRLFWVILAAISLSMGFSLPTSWLPHILHIPVLSNSHPTRIFGVWAMSATVLSAYGFDHFFRTPNVKIMFRILMVLSLLLIAGWIVVLAMWCITHQYPPGVLYCSGKLSVLWDVFNTVSFRQIGEQISRVSWRNLFLPSLILILLYVWIIVHRFSKKISMMVILVLLFGPGMYFAKKYLFFSDRRFVYPELPVIRVLSALPGYPRIWGYGHAFIEKNLPQYYRWYSTDGYGNLSSMRYAELLSTIMNNGKLPGVMRRRSDTDIYEASEWDALGSINPYRLRMMELLGVRYILESKKGELKNKRQVTDRFPESKFLLYWEDDTWRIWEYRQGLGRLIFAPSYLVREKPEDIVETLYSTDVDLSKTVILEKEPGYVPKKNSDTAGGISEVTIREYSMNAITAMINADTDGFLVFTDNWWPGWRASVDGVRAPLFRADYAFKAVYVPQGNHRVEFVYDPLSVKVGLLLSAIGILLCGTMCFEKLRHQRNYV